MKTRQSQASPTLFQMDDLNAICRVDGGKEVEYSFQRVPTPIPTISSGKPPKEFFFVANEEDYKNNDQIDDLANRLHSAYLGNPPTSMEKVSEICPFDSFSWNEHAHSSPTKAPSYAEDHYGSF